MLLKGLEIQMTELENHLASHYIECGNKYKKNSELLVCTRIKGHKGPHENYKGWSWEEIMPEVKEFSGVTSTKIPRFELIPFSALESLARIFEAGIEKKGDGAWNALTPHKDEALKDKAFVIERLSHVIKHCYQAIRKVQDGKEWEGEEDSGAILFGGAVLAEYKRMRKEP